MGACDDGVEQAVSTTCTADAQVTSDAATGLEVGFCFGAGGRGRAGGVGCGSVGEGGERGDVDVRVLWIGCVGESSALCRGLAGAGVVPTPRSVGGGCGCGGDGDGGDGRGTAAIASVWFGRD